MHTALRSFIRRRLGAATLLVSLIACGGADAVAPELVASVDVAPDAPALITGESMQLVAIPRSDDDEPLLDRPVTWVSTNADVAQVTPTGFLTAIAPGKAEVQATSEGVTGAVVVTVSIVPAAAIVIDQAPAPLLEGASAPIRARVLDAQGRTLEGRTLTWTAADEAIAQVSAEGVVTARLEGRTTITASHGAITSSVVVDVEAVFTADLLYEADPATELFPRIYRADPATGLAAPVFMSSGTWHPAASPDGSRIAFACQHDPVAAPSICTTRADGTDLRVLTGTETMHEDQPSWSPDGTRIAFRRWNAGATPGQFNQTDIWVMDADGTDQVNLTADVLVQSRPAWSPQPIGGAYRIVFTQEARTPDGYVVSRLHIVRDDGTGRAPLTAEGAHTEDEAAWSPDGSTIVFVRSGAEYLGELIAHDVASGTERLLLGATYSDEQRSPAWSPDGRFVAFTSNHEASPNGNYRRQVYTVNANGTGVRRRTTSDIDKANLAWVRRP